MGWRESRVNAPLELVQSRAACAVRRGGVSGPRSGVRRSVLGFLLLILGSTSTAQEVTGPALKAAFVYHMPKFTEWPDGALAPGSPFTLCVLADDSISDAFERMVKGRNYGGRRIVVSRLAAGAPAQSCHVLYISQGAARAELVLAEVRARPVLTISDIEGFTKLGGITQLYFEGGQLRMFIDVAAGTRAGLKFSARLLQLSKEP